MPRPAALLTVALAGLLSLAPSGPPPGYAELRAVDGATGRGVPLVELETVNGLKFVTDSAGRVALREPELMGREVFFHVRSHGYAVPKDGFGHAGVRVAPQVGRVAEIKLARQNVAERLCRLTGEGRYRDSELLGYDSPRAGPNRPGRVAGQDTVQATVHRGKVYWFWGDTMRLDYPLGLYRTAGATTPVPDPRDAATDPASGIAFDYFTDPKTGFARAMMPLPERPEGVIWIHAVFTAPDAAGAERLLGHYSRRKGLAHEYEQGVALFDDEKAVFEPAGRLPPGETWRRPSGHPIRHTEGGTEWLLFGSPTPNVRVPATVAAVLNPAEYEALACAEPAAGKAPEWRWQKELPPTGSKAEEAWVRAGKLTPEFARFYPADALAPVKRVVLHSGSVRYNEFRQRWVLLAGQLGGESSHLGEVWYAESAGPTGPFRTAVKVATHDRQTFYNVCHHQFLDRDGGRVVHFEGTYTSEFSGNPVRTPRYDYNQILYRLDLNAPGLAVARAD